MSDCVLLAGTANPKLAEAVAAELGVELGAREIERFPDGEVGVRVEETIRGKDVFILQPTAPPVDGHLMELLALADTVRRSGAGRITAVTPYFGYSRSDRRHGRREPITARLVADLLQTAGVDHLVTFDLHSPQIEGFFHVPVENLSAVGVLAEALRPLAPEDAVVVSPDVGRVEAATRYAAILGLPLVILHKQRETATRVRVACLVGEVEDRPCIMIDDMIATGGTLAEGARALVEAGARRELVVAATHGLLLDGARRKLEEAGVSRVVVTDSVATGPEAPGPELRTVTIAPLIAGAIGRLRLGESLAELYR